MSRVGMNVTVMHRLADEFEHLANEINGLVFRVNGHVHRGVLEWLGDAAREYTNLWNLRSKVHLLAVEAHLLELVRGLRAQIAEQERTSASSGGATHGNRLLREHQSATYAHGMLRITGGSRYTGPGPTSVNDLLDPLKNDDKLGHSADPRSVYHYPGGIAVAMSGQAPNRHVIVTISGTRELGAGGADPDDLITNIGNLGGADTEKQHAIQEAMLRAGVTSSDRIMLVGHSMGGADAIAFSSNHVNDSRFHVSSIVTVDAPPTPKDPPRGVHLLAIEGSHDLVNRAGFEGSSRGPDVTVVPVPEPLLSMPQTNHDPAFIQRHLEPAQPTLEAFCNEPANKGFFTGHESTTQMYSNERTALNPLRYASEHAPAPIDVARSLGGRIVGAL